jgi:hypothetical protein
MFGLPTQVEVIDTPQAPDWVPRVNGIPAVFCLDWVNTRAWQSPNISIPTGLATSDILNRVDFWGRTEFTVLCIGSGDNSSNPDPGHMVYADNAAATEMLYVRQTGASISGFGRSGGATQWSMECTDPLPHTRRRRVVMAGAANRFLLCAEGGPLFTDTAGSVPQCNRMAFGKTVAGANTWNGTMEMVAYWPTRFTDEQCRSLSTSQATFFYLAEGDSISRSPAIQTSWPFYVHQTAPLSWGYQNLSVSSSSLGNSNLSLNISGSTRTATLDAAMARFRAGNPTAKFASVFWTGYNDKNLDGDSTTTFLNQYSAYLEERRLAGHTTRVVVGLTPSTTAGHNTWRNTVNSTLSTWVGSYCEYYVDWTGIAGFDDADASNVTYYSDGIHPTSAHSQTMATEIYDQALSLAAV